MENSALLERRERALGKGAPLFYTEPIQIVRGEGVYLYDQDGRQYVDMYNNVPCVGHAHPQVVRAIHEQAATLNVHSRYLHEEIVRLAERLAGLHGDSIESVVFACSGTEANEIAMTMARHATGNEGFICTNAAYHGNSQQVAQLSRVSVDQTDNPHVRSFRFPEKFRPATSGDEAALCNAYLAEVDAAIAALQASGVGVAALVVCSLLANEGLPDIPKNFMPLASERVRAAGGLVIADEVQAGYCRSGQWWGYGVTEFEPDIVVTGKPMGNGLPLSACAASHELVNEYRANSRYFNTFASSPLQAAAGNAVLDVIEGEGLAESVSSVGGYLRSELEKLVSNNSRFADVRGHGLFLALERVTDKDTNEPDRAGAIEVVNQLKDRGFLTSNAGAYGNVVKIRPPLVFSRDNADSFLNAFAEII